jgi:hypothetical protein
MPESFDQRKTQKRRGRNYTFLAQSHILAIYMSPNYWFLFPQPTIKAPFALESQSVPAIIRTGQFPTRKGAESTKPALHQEQKQFTSCHYRQKASAVALNSWCFVYPCLLLVPLASKNNSETEQRENRGVIRERENSLDLRGCLLCCRALLLMPSSRQCTPSPPAAARRGTSRAAAMQAPHAITHSLARLSSTSMARERERGRGGRTGKGGEM